MPHVPPTITTVVLAGGAARRMGGSDKGLMPLGDKAMIAHVLARLQGQGTTIVINCNRNQEQYAAFGYPLIGDTLEGGAGPLAGLLSALEQGNSDYVLCVPCDTPLLPHDLVERMLKALLQNGADACTVDDGARLHPVVLLVRQGVLAQLRDYLEQGGRKVHDWFYSVRHCTCDFSDRPESFANINTPQQLAELQQRLAQRAD